MTIFASNRFSNPVNESQSMTVYNVLTFQHIHMFHNNLVRVEEEEKINGSLQAKDQTFLFSTVFLHRIIMVYCVEILQR